ncbi:hypothetical protein F4821DRAFT_17365 [Hypoxylon rubiginosum]|uniref:Uncharacterized protein n=1 Tax=Hypoxylon rubiginosum TaxID=110542 RepID=A0ACC0CNA2_9PEZI|nr:hypothetical protein F4821DRAFT_17365 [Hypoxylon rubiginosum]
MVAISFLAILSMALSALATPRPITPDPSGAKNVGKGGHIQFIGAECKNSLDCATTACCAFVTGQNFGVCSGLGATTQAGKAGCGFGDGGAAPPAPPANNMTTTCSSSSSS